ncbi:MAG TPA: lipocalin-like domain-containing protein [Longimicrobiales bacterium]|nr:lipocalin-like domain-containing protein [Longimicrobiales bacterium]
MTDGKRDEPIMSRLDWAAFIMIVAVVLIEGWLFFGPGRGDSTSETGSEAADSAVAMSLAEAMGGGDPTGYARALEPREFDFPADHGAHPDFRTEWWYVTSNLFAEDGRRFGAHYTIFRSALEAPDSADEDTSASGSDTSTDGDWSTNDVYMGHFAVADVDAGTFTEAERFTRGAAGLAGSRAEPGEPFGVWMDDWEMASVEPAGAGPDGIFPLRLVARNPEAETGIDLVLTPEKPMVLQGDAGLSQKGDEPGNASFYYSFTRLRTEGVVITAGDTIAVTGQSWMDREWSTSALDETQEGWDWFALQLDDGRDLMVYRLRGTDGSTDPLSEGVLVDPAGGRTRLGADDFSLEVLETWASPIDGAEYPSVWRVDVPSAELSLRVRPVLRDQEMDVTVRYWEGAVDVLPAGIGARAGPPNARAAASPIGRGYVELTGYAGMAPPGG